MLKKILSGSYRTWLLGLALILLAIASQAKNLLDGDPTTVFNWQVLMAGVTAGFGLMQARDDKVTSEEAGANAPPRNALGLKPPHN